MNNNKIKNVLDGLTSRGVLSADGRRQMFAILHEQALESKQEIELLKNDLERVRGQRDAFAEKNERLKSLIPKDKLKTLDD